jgi:amino acid permease
MGLALVVSGLFAFLTFLSIHFLIASAHRVHRYDYHGLFELSFGAKRLWMLNVLIILQQLGSLTIYCLFIGRLVSNLIPRDDAIFNSTQFWTFVIMVVVIFPLTFPRQISALQSIAGFAILFVILLIAHSIFWWVKDVDEPKDPLVWFEFSRWREIIATFSVNALAFTCHLNIFPCLEQMRDCTVKRANLLGVATIGGAFFLYAMLGLFTYFDKRDSLMEKITLFEHYPSNHPFTIVSTAGVVVILIACSPIQLWSLRNSVNDFFFKGDPMTPLRWVCIGGGCSLIAAFLSSTSDNITVFFDLVGGVAAPLLIFTLPALFYMKCRPNAGAGMKYLAIQHIAFTLVGAVASLYQAISNIIIGK